MLFWHKHNLEKSLTDLANFTPFPGNIIMLYSYSKLWDFYIRASNTCTVDCAKKSNYAAFSETNLWKKRPISQKMCRKVWGKFC